MQGMSGWKLLCGEQYGSVSVCGRLVLSGGNEFQGSVLVSERDVQLGVESDEHLRVHSLYSG